MKEWFLTLRCKDSVTSLFLILTPPAAFASSCLSLTQSLRFSLYSFWNIYQGSNYTSWHSRVLPLLCFFLLLLKITARWLGHVYNTMTLTPPRAVCVHCNYAHIHMHVYIIRGIQLPLFAIIFFSFHLFYMYSMCLLLCVHLTLQKKILGVSWT